MHLINIIFILIFLFGENAASVNSKQVVVFHTSVWNTLTSILQTVERYGYPNAYQTKTGWDRFVAG